MFDSLRFAIALLPIGIYFLVVATLLLRRRPTLLNAAQETLMLGMGCVGLAIIGPMELFFPNAAYSVLGEWTWAFLLGLYFFIMLFIALNRRPYWTIYGMNSDSLKELVSRTLDEEGLTYEWLDRVLSCPELGMVAMVEPATRGDRVAHLSPSGAKQDILGWHRLERKVLQSLARGPSVASTSGPAAKAWVAMGISVLFIVTLLIVADMQRLQDTVSWLLAS